MTSKSAHPRIRRIVSLLSAGILVVTGLTVTAQLTSAAAAPITRPVQVSSVDPAVPAAPTAGPGYAHPKPGLAACDALIPHLRSANGDLTPSGIVTQGWKPADLQDAYNLPSAYRGDGQTVGIVDAFDDSTAESDLAVYRLPIACRPVPPPTAASARSTRTARAVITGQGRRLGRRDLTGRRHGLGDCPRCHIVLVETDDNSLLNLATGAQTAARWAPSTSPTVTAGRRTAPKRASIRSTGRTASSSPRPLAIRGGALNIRRRRRTLWRSGGTSLLKSSSARGWAEIAWMGGGSGCSMFEAKPAWQRDTGCAQRSRSRCLGRRRPVHRRPDL